jgi:hypothetical protein
MLIPEATLVKYWSSRRLIVKLCSIVYFCRFLCCHSSLTVLIKHRMKFKILRPTAVTIPSVRKMPIVNDQKFDKGGRRTSFNDCSSPGRHTKRTGSMYYSNYYNNKQLKRKKLSKDTFSSIIVDGYCLRCTNFWKRNFFTITNFAAT